jgi:adenylosuccinate lyase
VITRYTRPEMGAIWTDEARMERWRHVEVAAAEELDGPSAADLRRSPPRRSASARS